MKNNILTMALGSLFAISLLVSCAKENRTEFGNMYEHHEKNNGPVPQPGDYIYFHYSVKLDDSLIENSWTRGEPTLYQMPNLEEIRSQGGTVSPVLDGIGMMSPGDSLTIYTEVSKLPQKPASFEGNEFVYYDIKLYEIKSEEQYQAEETERNAELARKKAAAAKMEAVVASKVQDIVERYRSGALKDSIQTTSSGLKYILHKEGSGPMAEPGKPVKVHYYGVLTDGTMFDNSYRRGDVFTFTLGQGQVIKGWDEGIALLKTGGQATLIIPHELGYGERGAPPSIPPKSELIFHVELH
jgi:FKBP-type peptidyl-prolyl cis-trans isomerase FkpA